MNLLGRNRKPVKETVSQLFIWGIITLSFLSLPNYLSAYDGNGRAYVGPFTLAIQTENNGNNQLIKEYLENADAESGRIMEVRQQSGGSTVTSYTTLFLVKDHLGSVRAVTDSYGHVLERNSYYPFGLQTNQGESYPTISGTITTLYPNILSATSVKRDLYNGKEIQTVAGTDYLDYGFRQYDPVTARWMAVDPKAEKYTALTPYNFCAGNPMIIIDLLGKDIWEINKIGKIVKHIKDKSQDTFYLVDDKGNRTTEKSSIEGNKSSSITFEYGTIKYIYKKYEKEEAETCYSISNEASGAELFKFFADNTKIEYGLINTQEDNSFLITNH